MPPLPPLQGVLWCCLLTVVYAEPTTACRENQYLLNNQCCDLCPPGKNVVNECTESTETQCQPCSQGEFSDAWNRDTRCHQHRYCDSNLGLRILKEGTAETDTVCTCEEGQHCMGHACESCALHTLCGPGFGVKQIATEMDDTVCEPCPAGFFSNDSSASEVCRPWTSCDARDLVTLQQGTKQSDVICGPPSRRRALLAIPVVMGLLCALAVAAVCVRKAVRKPKAKALHLQDAWKGPVEMEDIPGHNPAAPVQETLLGCQPVTQEDGKESRISVQERQ
ncbi:tumor necrosis factor receptor superfamily member 5 [Perognathus longimembris pacificus]|uniref:tumor necrosis factor receptor superfamily member 5 n=1 Tax=Perognathus longimembris pacificus TaxID=214514 RepID=UPI002019F086|nr:tumor necrosis factor receptor superfamily member 5 [Perognathus longimembris pacificus]